MSDEQRGDLIAWRRLLGLRMIQQAGGSMNVADLRVALAIFSIPLIVRERGSALVGRCADVKLPAPFTQNFCVKRVAVGF